MKTELSKIVCLVLFTALMILLCSCSGNAAMQYEREIEGLQETVTSLETTINILEAKIDVLEGISAGQMSFEVPQG